MYVDLHCHSHYSDGIHGPKDILARAKRLNISVVSLTDHNTVAGLPEARGEAKRRNIAFISGIELYIRYKRYRLHVLGYGFDPHNEELLITLEKLRKRRIADIHRSLTALKATGFVCNVERLFDTPSHYIGLGRIIGILILSPNNREKMRKDFRLEEGMPDFFSIINRYFKKERKTRLEETALSAKDAIRLLRRAGAVTVLAHPGHHLSWREDTIISELKILGLQGIEAYSPYHNWHQVAHYQQLAVAQRLFVTGGTDFHVETTYRIPEMLESAGEYFKVPKIAVQPFLEKIQRI